MLDEEIYLTTPGKKKKSHTGLKIFLVILLVLFLIAGALAGLLINKNRYRVNGIVYYNQKDYDQAVAAFDKGIESFALFGDQLDDDMRLYEGAIFLEKGDYQKATEVYALLNAEGKLSADEELLRLKSIADGILAYQTGDYQGAVDILSPICDPRYNALYLFCGSAYRHLGDVENMKTCYDSYVATDAMNSFLCSEYAAYYLETGNLTEAKYNIDTGLSIADGAVKELKWEEIVYYEYAKDYQTAYDKLKSYKEEYGELSDEERKDETFLRTRMTE